MAKSAEKSDTASVSTVTEGQGGGAGEPQAPWGNVGGGGASHTAFADETVRRGRGRPAKGAARSAGGRSGASITIPGPVTITRETLARYAALLDEIEAV